MLEFSKRFPEQFHDVAIAEQHAVTFAAGLACEGFKPIVAIYSSFLQRAYDQLIHDVALQNLDVTFGIDRAGLVGEDGPTHAGSFDISFLRCIPNMVIATPSDENECRQLLGSSYNYAGPAAVRYPRGTGPGVTINKGNEALPIGKGRILRTGQKVCLLNFGVLLPEAAQLAEAMDYSLCDMRWAKPIDTALLEEMAATHDYLVTLEENTITGGAGAGCTEHLMQVARPTPALNLGLPDFNYEHGKRSELLDQAGLSYVKIYERVNDWVTQLEQGHKAQNISQG